MIATLTCITSFKIRVVKKLKNLKLFYIYTELLENNDFPFCVVGLITMWRAASEELQDWNMASASCWQRKSINWISHYTTEMGATAFYYEKYLFIFCKHCGPKRLP